MDRINVKVSKVDPVVEVYEPLFDKFISGYADVDPGVMMREPALKCGDKVFAFYYADKESMCFKLGKDYHIEAHGVTKFGFLSPFKNKPPMYAWYLVGKEHQDAWEDLTFVALEKMRG